jgi:hypothetical protein
MANHVVHFAIHADDVERARRFYAKVFGWRFEPWGPPDFYLISTGSESDPGIGGALQKRRDECTVSVEDVDRIAARIEQHGGSVVMPKVIIPSVGWLIQFQDTEGNIACAMRCDSGAE